MSIASYRLPGKQNYIDLLFVFFALTLVLLVMVPPGGNIYNSLRPVARPINNIHVSAPSSGVNENISLSADQRYWNANCNQGWSSNTRCDTIVARTQSCSVSVASAYCSQYQTYLQQRPNK